jgi:site-specific recombinase XerD
MAKSRPKNSWTDVVASFEDYLHQKGKSRHTITAYGNTLKSFGDFYTNELQHPGPYVSRLQENDLRAFIDHQRLTRYMAPASINRAVAALRFFARYALEKHIHKKDFAHGLKTFPVAPGKSPSRLMPKEIRRLIAAVDLDTKNGQRDLAIVQLLIHAGLRVGEVPQLAITDVVLQKCGGHIRVIDENTRSERIVPLNASARRALRNYLAIRGAAAGGDPFFISQRRKRISIQTVQFLVKKYLCAAGREDLSARDLRRHLACELFRKHKELPVVQQMLGHRNPATTARYLQGAGKDLSAALEELPENVYAHEQPKG